MYLPLQISFFKCGKLKQESIFKKAGKKKDEQGEILQR